MTTMTKNLVVTRIMRNTMIVPLKTCGQKWTRTMLVELASSRAVDKQIWPRMRPMEAIRWVNPRPPVISRALLVASSAIMTTLRAMIIQVRVPSIQTTSGVRKDSRSSQEPSTKAKAEVDKVEVTMALKLNERQHVTAILMTAMLRCRTMKTREVQIRCPNRNPVQVLQITCPLRVGKVGRKEAPVGSEEEGGRRTPTWTMLTKVARRMRPIPKI